MSSSPPCSGSALRIAVGLLALSMNPACRGWAVRVVINPAVLWFSSSRRRWTAGVVDEPGASSFGRPRCRRARCVVVRPFVWWSSPPWRPWAIPISSGVLWLFLSPPRRPWAVRVVDGRRLAVRVVDGPPVSSFALSRPRRAQRVFVWPAVSSLEPLWRPLARCAFGCATVTCFGCSCCCVAGVSLFSCYRLWRLSRP